MKKLIKIFLVLGGILCVVRTADAQVSLGISVRIAPPPLPVYEQPECPVDGWLWQPGYWAYEPVGGYYWVPGVWVAPPAPGLLWTPSYWGFDNGVYIFHRGYWAHHVGFYGGINYGFGYPGYGFYGGIWSGRVFRYNTAVFRINRRVVRHVYVRRVNYRPTASRASFNGRGGVMARPHPADRRAMNEHHFRPTHTQISHQRMAGRNPAQRLSANHGHPSTPAMRHVNNHAVSSRTPRPVVHRGNPAVHRKNPTINRNNAPGRNPRTFNRTTPQVNRSNPQHRGADRAQHIAPQRSQHTRQRNSPQRQMQPQRIGQQPNIPRRQQQHVMRPQRMPQPQHMGGRPQHGGGAQPHRGGGGFGGHNGGGHRP